MCTCLGLRAESISILEGCAGSSGVGIGIPEFLMHLKRRFPTGMPAISVMCGPAEVVVGFRV